MTAAALAEEDTRHDYVLRLFITGNTEKSQRAVRNITRLCEQHLHGGYDLEVIDVYQQPELAFEHQLVAAPTLFKLLPLPPRKMIVAPLPHPSTASDVKPSFDLPNHEIKLADAEVTTTNLSLNRVAIPAGTTSPVETTT